MYLLVAHFVEGDLQVKSKTLSEPGSPANGIYAVHPRIFYFLIFVSLGLPNLIYSGITWFDTLHIMKWTFAMVPVAIISVVGGISLTLYGNERIDFRILVCVNYLLKAQVRNCQRELLVLCLMRMGNIFGLSAVMKR